MFSPISCCVFQLWSWCASNIHMMRGGVVHVVSGYACCVPGPWSRVPPPAIAGGVHPGPGGKHPSVFDQHEKGLHCSRPRSEWIVTITKFAVGWGDDPCFQRAPREHGGFVSCSALAMPLFTNRTQFLTNLGYGEGSWSSMRESPNREPGL